MIPPILVDRASRVPIHRQLYEGVRDAILDGRLLPGMRVPPTRELARQFGIARTTVMTAYDHLVADGYLESRVGAWTSVAEVLPKPGRVAAKAELPVRPVLVPRMAPGAEWLVGHSASQTVLAEVDAVHNFARAFTPAVDAFPAAEWRQLVARRWRELTPASLMGFDTNGDVELRDAIRQHVRSSRGIECEPDQIVVTTGSQQGVEIVAQVALRPGDRVVIEDPSYLAIQNALRVCGAVLDPLPVDADGLRTDLLAGDPALVYVTPSFQFPTGAVLSRSRRTQLVDWAVAHRALVIEDDGDSDLGYDQPSPESLYTLDDRGVVVYLGTFTRVLNPSIQIGYMIVPAALAGAVMTAHRIIVRQTEIINQAALAKFIRCGSYLRHLRRLQRLHRRRRDCLIRCLREHFGDGIEIGPAAAGLHVLVRWPDRELNAEALSRVRAAGVSMMLVRPMCIAPVHRDPGAVLAYASMTEQQIEAGVRALSEALGPD